MKLSQLESFLAVADTLNFTAAAKSLFLSQPALSKQVALLEQELGVRLFVRDNRRVILTDSGRTLAEDARELMARMDAIVARVRQVGHPSPTALRIGCFDGAVTDDFLPPLLSKLGELSPSVRPELCQYGLGALLSALEEGLVDVVFTLDFALPDARLYYQRQVCTRQAAILYAASHPLAGKEVLTPADFSGQRFLSIDEPQFRHARQNQLGALRSCGITPGETLLVPNMLTLLSHLEMGVGLAVLGARATGHKPNQLLAWPLPPPAQGTGVVAVWPKASPHPLVETLMAVYNQTE